MVRSIEQFEADDDFCLTTAGNDNNFDTGTISRVFPDGPGYCWARTNTAAISQAQARI